MKIGAIILAAGRSERFEGGHKLLHPIDGMAMVRHVALRAAASPCDPCLLVVAAGDTEIAAAAGSGCWTVVQAADAALGMSASLRAGLRELEDCDGVMIFLADMPYVPAALAGELIAAFNNENGRAIVFPRREDGQQGHPVLWPRALFGELMALRGDSGGRAVLAAHPELCYAVPCNDSGAFRDIDTRADLSSGSTGAQTGGTG